MNEMLHFLLILNYLKLKTLIIDMLIIIIIIIKFRS